MSGNRHHNDPDQDQDQLQAQLEAQAQGQLQGQANLQGQLQGQGQGQGQGQSQSQYETQLAAQGVAQGALQFSENENENKNESENKNENSNENKLESSVDNKLDNDIDNSIENKVENTVENNVETDVDVKIDIDLSGLDIQPAIDVGHLDGILFQMPDDVNQQVYGNGTATNFNLDQVNNLIDNDYLSGASVSYCAPDATGVAVGIHGDAEASPGFSMSAHAEGGYAKIEDADAKMNDGSGASVAAEAAASIAQDAFSQSIVMGANIQFNSVTVDVAGHDVINASQSEV